MEAQPRTVAGGEGRIKAASPAFIFFFVLLCKRATVLTKFPAQKVIEHLEVTKGHSSSLAVPLRCRQSPHRPAVLLPPRRR